MFEAPYHTEHVRRVTSGKSQVDYGIPELVAKNIGSIISDEKFRNTVLDLCEQENWPRRVQCEFFSISSCGLLSK